MNIRLLTEPEFKATMGKSMIDITGREDIVSPSGVLDIFPYVDAVPHSDISPHELDGQSVEYVYRSNDNRYDHVLLMTKTKNVYLVIVVDLKAEKISGHKLLDLNKEYGISERDKE